MEQGSKKATELRGEHPANKQESKGLVEKAEGFCLLEGEHQASKQ